MYYEGYDDEYLWGKSYPQQWANQVVPVKPKENKLLTSDEQKQNALKIIADELNIQEGKGIILIEPAVDIKFKQMMAIAGDKEVFGKLLIEKSNGYLTVKDVLIPYQVVWGAQYDSRDELINKFLAELSWKDPKTKEFREEAEINSITQNLNGHFHSHNSVGKSEKPNPSTTDTQDMIRNRDERPYWVEIIGTMNGYSGRITITEPMILMSEVEVKVRWWGGIESLLEQTENKIYTEYTYKKDIKKAEEDAKKEAEKPKTTAIVQTRGKKGKKGKNRIPITSQQTRIIDMTKMMGGKYIGSIMWDEKDPIQTTAHIVPVDLQRKIADEWKGMLKPNEKIMIDIFDSEVLDWMYVSEDNKNELVLSRWQREKPQTYKLWLDFCDNTLGCEDDLNYWYINNELKDSTTVRTIRVIDDNQIKITNYLGERFISLRVANADKEPPSFEGVV